MVGDLEQAQLFNCRRRLTPSFLLVIDFIIVWYIWPNRPRSLSVYVSCLLSVVAYLGSRENASMPHISRGN